LEAGRQASRMSGNSWVNRIRPGQYDFDFVWHEWAVGKTILPDLADILPAVLPICPPQSPEILSANSTKYKVNVTTPQYSTQTGVNFHPHYPMSLTIASTTPWPKLFFAQASTPISEVRTTRHYSRFWLVLPYLLFMLVANSHHWTGVIFTRPFISYLMCFSWISKQPLVITR
jgi:hypothetical protein